jgi:3-hydroxyacyl-[acyl-carrier-protein] dehydratase
LNNNGEMLDWLPHRDPFRFLSEIVAVEGGRSGVARWCVTGDEWFLKGHFPGKPLVPGVLIAEAMAQLAGIVELARDGGRRAGDLGMLVHSDIRFKRPVLPPAELVLEASLGRSLKQVKRFNVQASHEGAIVASGTILLADVDPAAVVAESDGRAHQPT